MTITHVTALRNDISNAVNDSINEGSGASALQLRDGTTIVVSFPLSNPAFGAAVNGVITLADVPIEQVAVADGELDNFQILDRDGVLKLSGSVTGAGLGGDIEVSNINVADEQQCSLDSLTYTAPI